MRPGENHSGLLQSLQWAALFPACLGVEERRFNDKEPVRVTDHLGSIGHEDDVVMD